jgi:tripartite-type tricarboxylate transporter receptor subunit TctC
LRALGTSVTERDPLLPEIPTLHESGVRNFSASNWFAVFAPKKTPPEIVAKVNQAINRALASPKLKAQFAGSGNTPLSGTPADLTALIATESASYAQLIRKTGITID